MRRLAVLLSTMCGIGYFPVAPGTIGSVLGICIGLVELPFLIGICVLITMFFVGVIAATLTESHVGEPDPSAVIFDEVWAMWAVMVVLPEVRETPLLIAISFSLFRLFDILKPPPLRWLDKRPRGWGIMLDDLGAAVYTIIIILIVTKIL